MGRLIKEKYEAWKAECNARFAQLKANEEELNRIFIDIYGLQDELKPEVTPKDVTVTCVYDTWDDVPEELQKSSYVKTRQDAVKSLVSYAVGCMMGRYSLDVPGLAYAGGEWDDGKYISFKPDEDGIIPITDVEYFDDDIVGQLIRWLKTVYGEDTLEKNLDFVAGALGSGGRNSREIIRSYFLKDFYKDHCKIYQKRPIYWLLDSGRENGFKALFYLHRYNKDTLGKVNVDYFRRTQMVLEDSQKEQQDILDLPGGDVTEKARARKLCEKLRKQIGECHSFAESLSHLALDRIELDLDDGVKVNYQKLQTDRDGHFFKILGSI